MNIHLFFFTAKNLDFSFLFDKNIFEFSPIFSTYLASFPPSLTLRLWGKKKISLTEGYSRVRKHARGLAVGERIGWEGGWLMENHQFVSSIPPFPLDGVEEKGWEWGVLKKLD